MKNYRALIVEYDDVFVTTLTAFLARLHFFCTPEICKTAGEAFDRLNHQKFDIIFLDMHLPDLSGTELLRALPHQYPVVATAALPNYAVDCYDLNVIDYLLKPLRFNDFHGQ